MLTSSDLAVKIKISISDMLSENPGKLAKY
jgi:hypothetical protein